MALTVDGAIHTATETWRRLGVEQATAEEMAEELAADLTAASSDGRSIADYMGGDVEALATSWADERGLVPVHRYLKESAIAAAQGAALPALAALAFWFVGVSGLLAPSSESLTTTIDGHVLREIRQFADPGVPVMWVGLPVCVLVAFLLIRRAVRGTLQYHHAPAIEATMRNLTKALPVILAAAAVLSVAIGYFGDREIGTYQIFFTAPMALAGMIGTAAAGAAWVRSRTCPPVTAGS
ncbi:hypothetical protein [Streptomyces platensis]|uniref:hypothetical protein n=1 Tax=Streptomyces platensis TaxID=58346 RepID=UPI00332868A6